MSNATNAARYTTQIGRAAHSARPNRESLSKRLGVVIVRALRARDGEACVYCGATAEASGAHLHLDHLTPRSAGGADVPTNLVHACRSCNSSRQNMTLAQWSAYARDTRGLVFTATEIRAHARRLPRAIVALAA